MDGEVALWERFIASKVQHLNSGTQHSSSQASILGTRSFNLTSGSIALNADPDIQALMCELTVKPAMEILTEKSTRELARRGRYVDFVRLALACCRADPSGRAKKVALSVKAIESIHTRLVVDKPARNLQSVLLAGLDDVSPDLVPLVVDAILTPCLSPSRARGDSPPLGRSSPSVPVANLDEDAGAAFLVTLDILPKVLGIVAGVPALTGHSPVPEGIQGLSGAQYRDRVITRLLRARWPSSIAIGICQTLRDLDLGDRQLKVAISRVLQHLRRHAKLDELPPLTYQLLLLAGRGCKEAALEGVIRVFDRLDAAAQEADRGDVPMRSNGRLGAHSTEHLRLVEGTILLHFNFAMKQDHNLASCLLKGFERRAAAPEIARAFTPFRVALLLSLSRIQRFSQPVLDLVQEIVCGCLVYDHRRERSVWLESEEEACRSGGGGGDGARRSNRPAAKENGGGSDGEGLGGESSSSAREVEKILLAVVRSSRGWDHLVGSLLKLGLQLLDRGGSVASGLGGTSFATGAAKGLLEKLHSSRSHRASLRASHLGRVVLMETFKVHEVVRRQVLTSVLEQVTARSQGVIGYVKLLGLLSKNNPQLLLQDAEAVRDVFGYISELSPPVAERFLAAVGPLLQLRPRLEDSVVLPLRKALFSREERARLVAVGGLVLLLGRKNRGGIGRDGAGTTHGGTQLSQMSQTSDSLSAPFPVGGMGVESGCALSLVEGFGLLRRCLTQQLVVRAKLYDGLLSSFERGSLEFQFDAISLLMGHLRRFVNRTGDGALLALGRCLDSSTGEIVEPLPLLIGCLHRMVVLARENLAEHPYSQEDSDRTDYDRGLHGGTIEAGTEGAAEPLREIVGELEDYLRKLSAASSSATLEDFGLDKVADFSPSGGASAGGKIATAALLCGCYEALMQGALVLIGPQPASRGATARLPTADSVRALLKLFDRRQALLDLVRSKVPSSTQYRGKKAAGKGAGGSSSILEGDADSLQSAGAGIQGVEAGRPGFSPGGCFGLTLYPGGMSCLGMTFVEDMLAALNLESEEDGLETEGDTEHDQCIVEGGSEDHPLEAVKEDLGLQRLVLETCRGHLRQLRTATVAASDGLSLEVGGGASSRGIVSTSCATYGGAFQDCPQDEADAARAGKAGVKRCIRLAPLLMKEIFRQLAEGNDSSAAKAAAAAAKSSTTAGKTNGSKGKNAGGDKGQKKSSPAESLSELSLSCLEECVCIAAYSSSRALTRASRTAKLLEAAYKNLPGSNVAPADPARGTVGSSSLGKHAEALIQTLTNLVGGGQTKEAEAVCRILSQLTPLLRLEPECLEKHGASLKLLCRQQRIQSPVLAKAIVSLYLQAHVSMKSKGADMSALQDLATQVRACVGRLGEDYDEEDEEDEPPALTFEVINNFTVVPISEVTVRAVETCIDDVEIAVLLLQKASLARQARDAAQSPKRFYSTSSPGDGREELSQYSAIVSEGELSSDDPANSDRNSDSDDEAAGLRSDGSSGERDPLDRRETLVCNRLQAIIRAMEVLVVSRLEGRLTEKLVSSASRLFRIITKVLKVRLSLKKAYIGMGLRHVLARKKDFTDALLRLVPHLEDEKGAKVTKNNISRQSRLVPALIFEMEECDVQLLKMGKMCKSSLDLPKWVGKRVDRDFRINRKAIASCQEETRASREKRKRKGQSKKGVSASKKKTSLSSKAQVNDASTEAREDDSAGEQGHEYEERQKDDDDDQEMDDSGEEE